MPPAPTRLCGLMFGCAVRAVVFLTLNMPNAEAATPCLIIDRTSLPKARFMQQLDTLPPSKPCGVGKAAPFNALITPQPEPAPVRHEFDTSTSGAANFFLIVLIMVQQRRSPLIIITVICRERSRIFDHLSAMRHNPLTNRHKGRPLGAEVAQGVFMQSIVTPDAEVA